MHSCVLVRTILSTVHHTHIHMCRREKTPNCDQFVAHLSSCIDNINCTYIIINVRMLDGRWQRQRWQPGKKCTPLNRRPKKLPSALFSIAAAALIGIVCIGCRLFIFFGLYPFCFAAESANGKSLLAACIALLGRFKIESTFATLQKPKIVTQNMHDSVVTDAHLCGAQMHIATTTTTIISLADRTVQKAHRNQKPKTIKRWKVVETREKWGKNDVTLCAAVVGLLCVFFSIFLLWSRCECKLDWVHGMHPTITKRLLSVYMGKYTKCAMQPMTFRMWKIWIYTVI